MLPGNLMYNLGFELLETNVNQHSIIMTIYIYMYVKTYEINIMNLLYAMNLFHIEIIKYSNL